MKQLHTETFYHFVSKFGAAYTVQVVLLTGKINKKYLKKSVSILFDKYEILQQGIIRKLFYFFGTT